MKTIGIKLADGSFFPVLEDGSPSAKSLELTTAHNNQTKVMVDLYSSESCSMDDAEYVDSLQINNLNSHPNGEPSISFSVAVDENNRLSANIEDPETGRRSETAIPLISRTIEERAKPDEYDISNSKSKDNKKGLLSRADDINKKKTDLDDLDFTNEQPSDSDSPDNLGEDTQPLIPDDAMFSTDDFLNFDKVIPDSTDNENDIPEKEDTDNQLLDDTDFNPDDLDNFEEPAKDDDNLEDMSLDNFDESSLDDNFDDLGDLDLPDNTVEDFNLEDLDEPAKDNDSLEDMSLDSPDESSLDDNFDDLGDLDLPDNTTEDFNLGDLDEPAKDDDNLEDMSLDNFDEGSLDDNFDAPDNLDLPDDTVEDFSLGDLDEPAKDNDNLEDMSLDIPDESSLDDNFDDLGDLDLPDDTAEDFNLDDLGNLDETAKDDDSLENMSLDSLDENSLDDNFDDFGNLDLPDDTVEGFNLDDMDDFDEPAKNDDVIFEDPISVKDETNPPETDVNFDDLDNFPQLSYNSTDFDEEDLSLPDFPEDNEFSSSMPNDFLDDLDNLDDGNISNNNISSASDPFDFKGLYDKETEMGMAGHHDTSDKKKKTKTPVIICIVCIIICLLALAFMFLTNYMEFDFITNKDSVETPQGKNIFELPYEPEEEKPIKIPENKKIEEEIKSPFIPDAKEDEIVIIEQAEKVIPQQPEPVKEKLEDIHYTVTWGDTLWDIANTYYKNPWRYKEIAELNGIKNPNHLVSGTVLVIPAE